MTDTTTKLYKRLLYVSRFLIDKDELESLSKRIPKLLTLLHVKDENLRINIVDHVKLVLEDLNNVKLSRSASVISKSTTSFIKIFTVLLGVLIGTSSLKNILINLLQGKVPPSLITYDFLKFTTRLASSLATLATFRPLVKLSLQSFFSFNESFINTLSTFLTTFGSVYISPQGGFDMITTYAISYSVDSIVNYLNDRFKLGFKSSWFLIPLSLSELYHDYIVHPEALPAPIIKLFNFLLKDLAESKPNWALKWPTVQERFLEIRDASILKSRRARTVLLHSQTEQYTLIQSNPSHTNRVFSILNPSEPSLLKIILKYIPKKLIILSVIILPLFILRDQIQGKLSIAKDSVNTTLQKLIKTLKSTLKLSSTLTLTTITTYLLTIQNNYSHSPIKNFRIIGILSGLWWVSYSENINKLLLTSLSRLTLSSTRSRLEKKFSNSYNKKIGDSLISGIAITTLITFIDNNLIDYISPPKLTRVLQIIQRGYI